MYEEGDELWGGTATGGPSFAQDSSSFPYADGCTIPLSYHHIGQLSPHSKIFVFSLTFFPSYTWFVAHTWPPPSYFTAVQGSNCLWHTFAWDAFISICHWCLSLPLSIQPSLDLAHITTPLYPFCQIPISLLADPLCSVSQGSYAWLCFFIPSLLPSPFLTKCFLKCIFFTYLPFFQKFADF
jgi:hypothetical protein